MPPHLPPHRSSSVALNHTYPETSPSNLPAIDTITAEFVVECNIRGSSPKRRRCLFSGPHPCTTAAFLTSCRVTPSQSQATLCWSSVHFRVPERLRYAFFPHVKMMRLRVPPPDIVFILVSSRLSRSFL